MSAAASGECHTRPASSFHAGRRKIFCGSRAVANGRLTTNELRSSAWQRLFRDVYADAGLKLTHHLMCQAVHAFLLPEGALIAGRSAAHLHGVPYVSADEPVEVLSSRRFGPVKGLKIHVGQVPDSDRATHDCLAVTTPERTCWDLALWLDPVEAVVFVDVLARPGAREPRFTYRLP